MSEGNSKKIYLIDATVEYNSWFSNSTWTEGYVAFVRGSDDVFDRCVEIQNRMLDEDYNFLGACSFVK